jgi:hypothetical protein
MDGQGATNPLAVPLKIGTLPAFLFVGSGKRKLTSKGGNDDESEEAWVHAD